MIHYEIYHLRIGRGELKIEGSLRFSFLEMGWGGGDLLERGGFIEGSWYESINKFTIRLLTGLYFIFYSNRFRILHLAG